jgi:hypothetical protein
MERIRRSAGLYFVDQAQSLPGEKLNALVTLSVAKRNDFKALGTPGKFVPVDSGAECFLEEYVYHPDTFRITNSPKTPLQEAPNAYRYNSIPQIGCLNQRVVEFESYGTHGTPSSDHCTAANMYGVLNQKAAQMANRWKSARNTTPITAAFHARLWDNQAAEFKELQRLHVLDCMKDEVKSEVKKLAKLAKLTPVSRTLESLDRDTISIMSKAANNNQPLLSRASFDLFSKQKSSFPGLVDAGIQDDSNRVTSFPNILKQKSIAPGGPKVVPDASEVLPPVLVQPNTEDKDNTTLIVAGVAVAALVAFSVFKTGKK